MRSLVSNAHDGPTSFLDNYKKIIFFLVLILVFIYFSLVEYFHGISEEKISNVETSSPSGYLPSNISTISLEHKCDIFRGDWVHNPRGPYYTNESGCFIEDGENCIKFRRPDSEYMMWRWRPNGCELPIFDATTFLEIMRGKSMAFVGDSVARNHMQSLGCLLSSVALPRVGNTSDTKIRRWLYTDYNFTLQLFSTTHLVQARNIEIMSVKPIDVYLDEPDEIWANKIDEFDYVVISAGHWFSRPLTYYEEQKVVGCHMCNTKNMTDMTRYYGYRKAFKTAFRTILDSQRFKGTVILRTISPTHFNFEDGERKGNCKNKRPFRKQEMGSDWYLEMFHMVQMEEFREAERKGKGKGVKFKLLDITYAMRLRPDGHPDHYGHPPEKSKGSDCLHWCLPGAIDTWNQLLLEMLKTDSEGSFFDV